jgi:precorrin-2 dehydrogenase / sirohydrochlorin ferrochelatase
MAQPPLLAVMQGGEWALDSNSFTSWRLQFIRDFLVLMFYPVYLNLKSKRVVVIGAGEVAERKVESLLDTGATIVVISPEFTARVASLADQKRIELQRRPYVVGDCAGAALIFSATDDPKISSAVYKEASALGVFVNTADQPPLCSFIMPAVVRRGDIGIAISTGGTSPALAARLRRKISSTIGPEYMRLAELLSRTRLEIRGRVSDEKDRKELHYRILDSDIITLLKQNDTAGAERRLQEIIEDFELEVFDKKTL